MSARCCGELRPQARCAATAASSAAMASSGVASATSQRICPGGGILDRERPAPASLPPLAADVQLLPGCCDGRLLKGRRAHRSPLCAPELGANHPARGTRLVARLTTVHLSRPVAREAEPARGRALRQALAGPSGRARRCDGIDWRRRLTRFFRTATESFKAHMVDADGVIGRPDRLRHPRHALLPAAPAAPVRGRGASDARAGPPWPPRSARVSPTRSGQTHDERPSGPEDLTRRAHSRLCASDTRT